MSATITRAELLTALELIQAGRLERLAETAHERAGRCDIYDATTASAEAGDRDGYGGDA